MTRAWVVALLVAGCAPAPAEKLAPPTPVARPLAIGIAPRTASLPTRADPPEGDDERAAVFAFPRPELPAAMRASVLPQTSDVIEYLRWPLGASSHPVLEPAYPIARVFATPGIAWTELCQRGAQNRRVTGIAFDQVEYLRAWCDVARRDPEAAVGRLASLASSSVATMPDAVRRDIANIVVDHGDSALAQRTLARAHLDDVALYDLISASYDELGKTNDAILFNELAINAYATSKPGDHCHRLAKPVVRATDPAERSARLAALTGVSRDRTCVQLEDELRCWAGVSCAEYIAAHGIDHTAAVIVEAYLRWPEHGAAAGWWFHYATYLANLEQAPGLDLLATSALEAAMVSARCGGPNVHQKAITVPALRARLAVIVDHPEQLCPP